MSKNYTLNVKVIHCSVVQKMNKDINIILKVCGLPNRLSILAWLREWRTAGDIRKRLKSKGITKPYITIHRYLDEFRKYDLIYEENGRFILSELGHIIFTYTKNMSKTLDICNKYHEFFKKHTIILLPEIFIYELDILEKAELLEGPFTLLNRINDLMEASSQIDIMTHENKKEFVDKFSESKLGRIIYRKTSYKDNPEPVLHKNIQVKRLKEFNINIFIFDRKASIIIFPLKDGSLHMNNCFFSRDTEFVNWTQKIFDYYMAQ